MTRRPLGCMTFSALAAAVIVLLAIAGTILVTGNSMFSPGALSAITWTDGAQAVSAGGVTSHSQLEGRCDACHVAIWSGERMGDRCLACHQGVAQEVAAGSGLHGPLEANAGTCLRCHTEHRGTTASATSTDPGVFPHERTGFALTAHARPAVVTSLGCGDCHPSAPRDHATSDCLACHRTRDAAKMATHTDTYGSACLNCHDGKDTYGHAFEHTSYPLTGRHASAACAGCHRGSTTLTALRSTSTICQACHGKDDIHQGRLGALCGSCHTPDGWAGATLDHATQTRFPLTGKHVGVACESCHVDRQWTGLGTACVACHANDDPHDGRFGTDCASCHNASDWKNVTFDHALTGFPLTQGHANVTCAQCHPNDRFAGTSASCASCHASQDKHKGALGSTCETCHRPTQWSDASFDHGSTAFKLTGAHVGATCEQCHLKPPPSATSTSCASCHAKPASHDQYFAGDCGSCHTTKAWRPAAFDHARTTYKLTGAHLGVACLKCHTNPKVTYTGAPTTCAACHTRPSSHPTFYGNVCSLCHTTSVWLPIHYTAAHRFPVTHGGAGSICTRCHTSSLQAYTCSKCHSDASMNAKHQGISGYSTTTCAKCHPTGRGD